MKRFDTATVLLLMFVVLGLVRVSAAPLGRAYLPLAYSASPTSVCDGSAPILDQDTGSLSVVYQDGHWYVAYQNRARGGRGELAEHVGDHLVDVASPIGVAAPAFSPPDSVKVGSVALAISPTERRWYYTSRKPGDSTGPYGIWCTRW